MLPSLFQRHFLLLVIVSIVLSITVQVFLFMGGEYLSSQLAQTQARTSGVPTATPTVAATPVPTQPATFYQRPAFQTGVVFPQWSSTGYGPNDPEWQQGLYDIRAQAGARWLEMPILFSQDSPTSTQVTNGPSTPTVESIAAGIRAARALGYHVFVVPLLGVIGPGEWAASIHFSTYQEEEQWFNNFWQTFQPYAVAAEVAGAEQLSIGTEEVWLQQHAPAALWDTLIARVRRVFSGTITYDMNWTTVSDTPPTWMSNQNLGMIGVSEYIPLVDVRERLDPPVIFRLWRDKIKRVLDDLSIRLQKPIVISEIGYRNSADALYHPWFPESTVSPPDPVEQAAACDAALANVITDPHIAGIFFWGWDAVGGFKLSGQSAVRVLHKWYTSPQS